MDHKDNPQIRKTNKPLTEKRRRERINKSLLQLKHLVLRGTNKQNKVKLEKADIMDMAVRYIEDIQQKQILEDHAQSKLTVNSYIQGYSSCINEVSKIPSSVQCINNDVKYNVCNHLSTTLYTMTAGLHLQEVSSTHSFHTQSMTSVSDINDDRIATSTPYNTFLADDIPTNQLSLIFNVQTPHKMSPRDVWSSYHSSFTSHSADSHQASVSPDSGVHISSADSLVWRPW